MEAGLNKTSLMRALFINVIQLTFNQNRNTDAFIMYAPAVEFFFFFFLVPQWQKGRASLFEASAAFRRAVLCSAGCRV